MTQQPNPQRMYTVAEAAELTGLSEKALRNRMDRGSLTCVQRTLRGRRQRMIPHYALTRAGLLGNPNPTKHEKGATRLVGYLSKRPDKPLTTTELAFRSGLTRQACEAAMGVLLALDHVRKSYEPPPVGTGRPRVVWRWVTPSP